MKINTLSLNLDVPTIVREYRSAIAQIETAYETLQDQQDRLRSVLGSEGIYTTRRVYNIPDYYEEVKRKIEQSVWRQIIRRLGIKKILSLKKQKELENTIKNNQYPPLTVANIYAEIEALKGEAVNLFEESIREVFDWLRPRDAYVSNSEWVVEGRVILKNVLRHKVVGGGLEVNFGYIAEIKALDKVFHILDGKPFVSANVYSSPLLNALAENPGEGMTEYFKYRGYHKGTLHIWFRREDLVQRFNRIGGGGRLMPSRK